MPVPNEPRRDEESATACRGVPVPARPAVEPTALAAAQALQRAGPLALLSHESAARVLGIELLEDGRDRLTVPRDRSRLSVPGWCVARSEVPTHDRELVGGLPCTGAVRTVADLSRILPFEAAVVAADSALRQSLVPEEELTSRLSAAAGRRAAALRAVAAALDPRSGSVLETLLRLVLRGVGLHPVSQYVIHDRGEFVARVDFCWPDQRLVVEADGFAFHADRAAYRRDRDRLNALERLGWRVLRFTWEDVRSRPDYLVGLVRECLGWAAA
jgi:very-short-patch-repair endonuclease